jgi:hypothetical protein
MKLSYLHASAFYRRSGQGVRTNMGALLSTNYFKVRLDKGSRRVWHSQWQCFPSCIPDYAEEVEHERCVVDSEGDGDGVHGDTQATPRKRKTGIGDDGNDDHDNGTSKQKKARKPKQKAEPESEAQGKEEDNGDDLTAEKST